MPVKWVTAFTVHFFLGLFWFFFQNLSIFWETQNVYSKNSKKLSNG